MSDLKSIGIQHNVGDKVFIVKSECYTDADPKCEYCDNGEIINPSTNKRLKCPSCDGSGKAKFSARDLKWKFVTAECEIDSVKLIVDRRGVHISYIVCLNNNDVTFVEEINVFDDINKANKRLELLNLKAQEINEKNNEK